MQSRSNSLAVTFGQPRHGWLPVTVMARGTEIRHDVSDVPGDTLSELVSCLSRLVSGSGSEVVEWHLEPESWLWRFDVHDGVASLAMWSMQAPVPIVEQLATRRLVRAICESLARLGKDPAWSRADRDTTVWSWEFPYDALALVQQQASDA